MDGVKPPRSTHSSDGLEQYRRLVQLQSQIVELARRNHESERICRALRADLVPSRAEPSFSWTRRMLLNLVERIRRRRIAGAHNGTASPRN